MRRVIAADHNGFTYKTSTVRPLAADGHHVTDLGTSSTAAADYPDYARAVGTAVRDDRADFGVLICGSGAGVAIAANKLRGVRAALCHDLFTARQSREDDDANVICLGAEVVEMDLAIRLTKEFVSARFSHAERHERRLRKVLALERAEMPAVGEVAATTHANVEAAQRRLESLNFPKRLWAEDPQLWSDAPAVQSVIVNRLGWLNA